MLFFLPDSLKSNSALIVKRAIDWGKPEIPDVGSFIEEKRLGAIDFYLYSSDFPKFKVAQLQEAMRSWGQE